MIDANRCPSISWDDIFKLKIRNFDESTDIHDVVKLLIMRKLAREHKNEKNYIRIYSEYPVRIKGKLRIADIVYQNIRTKEMFAFEIQKDCSKKWMEDVSSFYSGWEDDISSIFFKTAELITIPINKFSETIDMKELKKQLERFIV